MKSIVRWMVSSVCLRSREMKQTLTKGIVNNNEVVIRHHFLLENRPTTTLYNISTEKVTILTLWLFIIAMENGPFIDDFPSIKTSIFMVGIFHGYVSHNQMVIIIKDWLSWNWLSHCLPSPGISSSKSSMGSIPSSKSSRQRRCANGRNQDKDLWLVMVWVV